MVLGQIADVVFPKQRADLVEGSFFALQGLMGGILLNDIWRWLDLPGNDEYAKVPIIDKEIRADELYQQGIGLGIAALGLVGIPLYGSRNNSIALGAGTMLGSHVANESENYHYIGLSKKI